jgi:hypothetical protein
MLCATKRLANHLKSTGNDLFEYVVADIKGGYDPANTTIDEAEFVGEPVPSAGDSALVTHPGFDFSMCNRLKQLPEDIRDKGYVIKRADYKCWLGPLTSPHGATGILSASASFDILWVSATEFVTRHKFKDDKKNSVQLLYSMDVHVNGAVFSIRAYRSKINTTAPAGAPLRFLSDVLAPVLHTVPRVVVKFWTTPPVDAVLSLVPTTEHAVTKSIELALEGPTVALLRALALHPVHSRVLLRFERGWDEVDGGYDHRDDDDRATNQETNDILRDFRHPVRLQIPFNLLDFECSGESFARNPAIESLTITGGEKDLSASLLEGISRNDHLTHLILRNRDWELEHELRNWDYSEDTYSNSGWNATLFRDLVWVNANSIQSLTLLSHYNYFSSYYQPLKEEQECFDKLTQGLESDAIHGHGLSTFRLAFPYSQIKPQICSNCFWDSRFLPSLVLNYLHQQAGGHPPPNASALAVQRINQGVLYSYSTNLAPWDISVSSACVMFDILRRCYHAKSGKAGGPAVSCKTAKRLRRDKEDQDGDMATLESKRPVP